MMLTWCAFAFFAPETVASLGAQYSFGITAALILALERLRDFHADDWKQLRMMPPGRPVTRGRLRFFRFKHRVDATLTVAVTAFAAAAMLSLQRQQLLVPGSVAANLLLPLMTPVLFGGMVFKLTVGQLIPAANGAGAVLLTGGFRVLTATVTTLSEWFGPVAAATPPVWYTAVYYLLFFTALGVRDRRIGLPAAAAAAIMLAVLPFVRSAAPGRIIFISRSADAPPLIACLPPGGETAKILNVPDSAAGALAGRRLRELGAQRAQLGFSRGVRRNSDGVPVLTRYLPCTAELPREKRRPSAAFQRNLRTANVRLRDPGAPNVSVTRNGMLNWTLSDGTEVVTEDRDEGRFAQVRFRDGRKTAALIPWCSLPVRWQLDCADPE